MTEAQKKSKKMLQRYPDHVPVVCSSSSGGSVQKLLVPKLMGLEEFRQTARTRCDWAARDSKVTLGDGKPLPELCSMHEVYLAHKNSDGLLQVLVRPKCSKEEVIPVADVGGESPSSDTKRTSLNSSAPQPQIFHMPDMPAKEEKLDKEAERARRRMEKYPDRVAVLVKQAQSIGLPEIDKKLLVPKSMTCAGLQQILPKHLNLELKGDEWKKLKLYMGDDPLKEHDLMEEIYNQYVDERDVCLHITVQMDLPYKHEPCQEKLQAELQAELQENQRQEKLQAELQAELQETKAKLEDFKEKASRAEEQSSLDAEKRLEAECKIIQLEELLASEAEKLKQLESEALEASERERTLREEVGAFSQDCVKLQASADELQKQLECTIAQKEQLSKALVSENRDNEAKWAAQREAAEQKAVEAEVAENAANTKAAMLERMLAEMKQRMENEKAEKIALQKEITDLQEAFRKEKDDILAQMDAARDGFVRVECDEYGLLRDDEESGFKIVSSDP